MNRTDAWQQRPSGLYIPEPPSRARYGDRPLAVDLFCGCGGFSLGVIQGGFRVVAACDNDMWAMLTYLINLGTHPCEIHWLDPADAERVNHVMEREYLGGKPRKGADGIKPMIVSGQHRQPDVPGVPHFWFGDCRRLTGRMVLDALGLEPGDIDLVCGGPPCQGFSIAGHRDVMDPRNSLVFEFGRLILELQPKTFVMENVPGLLSMRTPEGLPVVDAFCLMLAKGGYGTLESLKRTLAATAGAGAGVQLQPGGRGGDGGQRAPRAERRRQERVERKQAGQQLGLPLA